MYLKKLRNDFSTTSNKIFQKYLNQHIGEVIDDDKILGTWSKDNTNHRCIDVRCMKCGKERSVLTTIFFDKRPMRYKMCSCKSYSPNVIKEYKDTIRGTDIYIGLGAVHKGHQMVWVKCLVCNQYRKVKGIDYLNSKCIHDCKHILLNKSNNKVNFENLSEIGFGSELSEKYKDKKYKFLDKSYKNMIFNNLRVEQSYLLDRNKSKQGQKGGVYWGCQCLLCGNKVAYLAQYVVNGVHTNCGCKKRKYFEKYFIGDVVSNNFVIRDIIQIKGDSTYWNVQCPFCENTFVRKATDINGGHFKSCGCKQRSLGELYVKEILDKYNLNYKEQIAFSDLKQGSLRFDFMVIKNNKDYLIEYDGRQHYYESGQFTRTEKEKVFKTIVYNDNLKNLFCKNKGIPLLRIKYTLNKEKIEEEIKNFIGGF